MPADLMAEYEAPEKLVAPQKASLADEFDAPDTKDQHAIINDSADKARKFQAAFGPYGTPEARKTVAEEFSGALRPHMGEEQLKSMQSDWEDLNKPLVNLPQAPDVGELAGVSPSLPIIAGVYNGLAPVASSLTSPLNLATLGTFGALTKVAAGVGPAAKAAQAGLTLIKSYFAGTMAEGAGEAAGRASVPEGKNAQEQTADVASAVAQSALAALAGTSVIEGKAAPKTEETSNANPIQSPTEKIRVGPEPASSGSEVAGGVASEPVKGAGESEAAQGQAK